MIEREFSEESVDSKLKEALDKYDNDIKEKANILDDTINTLNISMDKLNSGSNAIAKGMNQLSNGLDKYNKQGIKKLTNIVNNDVKTTQKRLESVIKLSNDYRLIDSLDKGMKGKSKMIFMIDSITKNDIDTNVKESKEEKNKNEKKSLWKKIKGLFE